MQSYKIKVVIFAPMNRILFCLTFFSILLSGSLVAQQPESRILLTGVVLSGDPLVGVANTNIIVVNKNSGTASDENGFFSFYTEASDTILFSVVGFKDGQYVVPSDFDRNHYSIVQIMTNDTIWLQETIIMPWKDYDTFGDELITMTPPITDEVRAHNNLEAAKLYEMSLNTYMDAGANYKHQSNVTQEKVLYNGQMPPMQIINPFAWSRFIKSIKNGEYKK